MITVTSVEAQNKLGQLLDTAQREPVMSTRRSEPVAQFDVHRNKGSQKESIPFVVVIQSARFDAYAPILPPSA